MDLRSEDLVDLMPLRDAGGRPCGLFSDHGSWLGVTWGQDALCEVHDTRRNDARRCFSFNLGVPCRERRVMPDRLEAVLENGQRVRLGFVGPRTLHLECPEDLGLWVRDLSPRSGLGHRRVARGWVFGEALDVAVPETLWEQNRARWDEDLRRGAAHLPADAGPRDRRLMARALVTLRWNRRAPTRELEHPGVLTSPFGYPGYWNGDAWTLSRTLARWDPDLAAANLRALFDRQAEDGMVPDTAMPTAGDDNWRNGKPLQAAAALAAVHAHGHDGHLTELLPRAARAVQWWEAQRRQGGDVLFRPGGEDRRTATWDSGWDESLRFADATLSRRRPWRLLDVWPVDLNAALLGEYRALGALAPRVGEDGARWLEGAERLREALAACWDEERGAFLDRPAPGVDGKTAAWAPRLSAACWAPLDAGVGGARHAERARAWITDPEHFATPFPFPTLAASEPGFDPQDFFNGAAWPRFAPAALRVLGAAGAELRERLLDGIAARPSLYECYAPDSGQPAEGAHGAAAQSSLTAAALLEILAGEPGADPVANQPGAASDAPDDARAG